MLLGCSYPPNLMDASWDLGALFSPCPGLCHEGQGHVLSYPFCPITIVSPVPLLIMVHLVPFVCRGYAMKDKAMSFLPHHHCVSGPSPYSWCTLFLVQGLCHDGQGHVLSAPSLPCLLCLSLPGTRWQLCSFFILLCCLTHGAHCFLCVQGLCHEGRGHVLSADYTWGGPHYRLQVGGCSV
jgi:hypothetical protein